MTIEKKIKLNNDIYYVLVDIEYKKDKNDITTLKMKNYKDDYYDSGDFSLLIEKIELNYNHEKAKQYDKNISFMADVIYIYERIPFLGGIRDVYISKKDNIPTSICYISKNEIEKYIKENDIKITFNNNFKLSDERTWKV